MSYDRGGAGGTVLRPSIATPKAVAAVAAYFFFHRFRGLHYFFLQPAIFFLTPRFGGLEKK